MAPDTPVVLRPINGLNDADADQLTAILNEDKALRKWLGMENTPTLTVEEFKRTAEEWPEKNHAHIFIIYTQGPVGSISISHINEDGTARIGYWIASKAWNQGVGSAAFAIVLEKARQFGIHHVSAKIQADNIASLRIWQKWEAKQEILPEKRFQVTLSI